MGSISCYSLGELLGGEKRFRIPLYQRSYAWGEREIDQLLEDLWMAFKSNRKNYYLGTLVVMQREGNILEVVDGQQRLTTLTLLFRQLGLIEKTCPLCFENRPDASRFLDAFFCAGNAAIEEDERFFLGKSAVSAMAAACRRFTTYIFCNDEETADKDEKTINSAYPYATKPDEDFRDFLEKQVKLYQITLPERTDIAKYFEVMNNRGVQLADVDVVKSRLMQQYKAGDSWTKIPDPQEDFRIRWELCADFTRPRKEVEEKLKKIWEKAEAPTQQAEEFLQTALGKVQQAHAVARMDFPNFLLIALSLYQRQEESSISLDERQLLKTFTLGCCKDADFAKGFLAHLETVRDLFDTWFVRSDLDGQGNIQRWVIAPWREEEKTEADSTTRKQLIALEAMLEVTYTSRRNRTWVRDTLGFLLEHLHDNEMVTDRDLIDHLEEFVRERVRKWRKTDNWLCWGTSTPHLLLNLLDYLFMSKSKGAYIFKHRSTVEHFMPYNSTYSKVWEGAPDNAVDYIGNLCLLNNSDNSSLSNHSPEEKVNAWGKKEQAPKQHEMYETPQWTWEDCKAHHDECEQKLMAFLSEGDKASNP